MIKCSAYHEQSRIVYEYSKETGHVVSANSVWQGVCYGTKNQQNCNCGGDESKCDFYPERRENAGKPKPPKKLSYAQLEQERDMYRDLYHKCAEMVKEYQRDSETPAPEKPDIIHCAECCDFDTVGYEDQEPGLPELFVGYCRTWRADVQKLGYCYHGRRKDTPND